MAQKPSIPKGTRDFSPEEMAKRNYIFDTIKSVYRAYGFMEIETPAMENLSTLTGKYGDEGDKLLFRILNSGDSLKDFKREELLTIDANEFAARACERGLRYDLTVFVCLRSGLSIGSSNRYAFKSRILVIGNPAGNHPVLCGSG